MRKERKDEHIEQVMRTLPHGGTLLDQVVLEPLSFPELALDDVDPTVTFFGQRIAAPLYINAMTGGTAMTLEINRDLAQMARDLNLPMQVGSQVVALEEPDAVASFEVVRKTMGSDGVVIGNLSASASEEDVRRAMDMIGAQGVGIHLNPSQELAQAEGDRDFRGLYDNVARLADTFGERMIVKEVGFGMSRADGRRLNDLPLGYVDVSGVGGTNFMEVEDSRSIDRDLTEFYDWGVPTAKAIWNIRRECPTKGIVASGGITTATEVLKALVLGADLTAMSGEVLRYLLHGGVAYAEEFLTGLMENIRMGMLLLGARRVEDLKDVPHLLVGRLGELVAAEEAVDAQMNGEGDGK